MLRSRISHTNHIHNFFLPVLQFMLFFFFLGHLVISLIKRCGDGGGGREGGRKSRRASGILNVAISKVLNRSFISPHMSYNMFRGAAHVTTTENKPRTIVFRKNTSSFEYAPIIITKIINRCCQGNICASYSWSWVQISPGRRLILTNASVIFRVSVDKFRNNT